MKNLFITVTLILSACLPVSAGAQDNGVTYEISKEKSVISGVTCYIHKVKSGQTIYSLCRVYGIKQSDLIAANPVLKGGLKVNHILFIPVNKCNPAPDALGMTDAEAKARKEAEAKLKAAQEAKAEQLKQEQAAKEEAERLRKEQAAKEAAEKAEAERLRKEQSAKEEAEKAEAERLRKEQAAKEAAEKAEAERLRKEQAAKEEAEKAEAERLRKEQAAKEAAEKAEAERLRKKQSAKEAAEKAEAERLRKEQAAKEAAEKAEAERLRKEQAAKEAAEKAEAERLRKEQSAKEAAEKAEAERLRKEQQRQERLASIDDTHVITHEVRWFETLSNIARQYEVEPETIVLYNNLSSNIILPKDIIRIPVSAKVMAAIEAEAAVAIAAKAESEKKKEEAARERKAFFNRILGKQKDQKTAPEALTADTEVTAVAEVTGFAQASASPKDNTVKEEPPVITEIPQKEEHFVATDDESIEREIAKLKSSSHYGAADPLDITLVLPFNATGGEPSTNYLDFYSGVLMALKDAKEDGKNVNLHVIDFSTTDAASIIDDDAAFAKSDIIIGPVEAGDIPQFASFCRYNAIPFVSPMDYKADTLTRDNPNFFQMPVSAVHQYDNLASMLKPSKDESVIMIHNSAPNSSERRYITGLREAMKDNGVEFTEMSYTIQSGRTMDEKFRAKLSHGKSYKIIVASEDEAFASDIVRNMNLMHLDSIQVQLFGSPRLRNFEAVDPQNLYDLGYSYCTNYFVDYKDEPTRRFVLQYRALYKAEPTPYSFHGYDTFTFFINAMDDLGPWFMDYIDHYRMQLLQSNIHFKRKSRSEGFNNIATRNIEMAPGYAVKIRQ